jgi:hypothetical protein
LLGAGDVHHIRPGLQRYSQQDRSCSVSGPTHVIATGLTGARTGREQSQQNLRLFDHLVGDREHAGWNIEAKHFRGLSAIKVPGSNDGQNITFVSVAENASRVVISVTVTIGSAV